MNPKPLSRHRCRVQVHSKTCHWLSPSITGHRFYNPDNGRWLNRDPLTDLSFLRRELRDKGWKAREALWKASTDPAYLFVRNSAINAIDALGLVFVDTGIDLCIARGNTDRPYDHAWIGGNGWGAGFFPKGGGPKPPSSCKNCKGQVIYPKDPYSVDPKKKGKDCRPVMLDPDRFDVMKFRKCVKDTIAAQKKNPPRYHAIQYNCLSWAVNVISSCRRQSLRR